MDHFLAWVLLHHEATRKQREIFGLDRHHRQDRRTRPGLVRRLLAGLRGE